MVVSTFVLRRSRRIGQFGFWPAPSVPSVPFLQIGGSGNLFLLRGLRRKLDVCLVVSDQVVDNYGQMRPLLANPLPTVLPLGVVCGVDFAQSWYDSRLLGVVRYQQVEVRCGRFIKPPLLESLVGSRPLCADSLFSSPRRLRGL